MHELNLDRFIGKKAIAINEMCPILNFDEEGLLTIECSWRVRNNEIILVGCGEYDSEKTHKDAYKKLQDFLINKKIKNLKFIPPVSDLIIEFENGVTLELFSDCSIYENWTLSDGKGFELISLVAGDFCCIGK